MVQRESMITNQIIKRGVKNKDVIDALREVKRHLFVPKKYQLSAYGDHPLSIGHGQTISQPYIVAFMTEALDLQKNDKVLEIGTGSGYQAAILAEIVEEVYTIEIVKSLAESAKARLESLDYKNIFVKYGDGYKGWVEHATFDAIIVTAAPETVPLKLVEQLKVGGKMIVPVGTIYQELLLIVKEEDKVIKKSLLPVRFVPMVKE